MIRNSEERKTWSREAMLAAVLAVKSGNERLRSASKIYKVPKSSICWATYREKRNAFCESEETINPSITQILRKETSLRTDTADGISSQCLDRDVALQGGQDRKDSAKKFFEIHRRGLSSLQLLLRIFSLVSVLSDLIRPRAVRCGLFTSDTYVPISSEHRLIL